MAPAKHPGVENLRTYQRQLDMDGCEVGVSRQALDETLALCDELLAALKLAVAWWQEHRDTSLPVVGMVGVIAKAEGQADA